MEDESEVLGNVAVLIEMGLPSLSASWVFLSGIRSRKASTEIANSGVDLGNSLRQVRFRLRRPEVLDALNAIVSDHSQNWLSLHRTNHASTPQKIPRFRRFTVNEFNGAPLLFCLEALNSNIIFVLQTGDKKNLLDPIKSFHFEMLQMITGLHLKEIMMGVMT